MAQALIKDLSQSVPLKRILESRIERIDIDRQLALTPEVIERVLEARPDGLIAHAQ